jgi:hypothetical protein
MILPIENHEEQALARLFSYQKDYVNLRGVISIFAEAVQEIEDLLYSMISDTTLDMAAGATLDMWGALLNEPREGLSDIEYKKLIYTRGATRNSPGTAEDLFYIFNRLSAYSDRVRLMDHVGIARFEYVSSSDPSLTNRRRLTKQIKQATSAGVGVNIVQALPGYFGFKHDPEAKGFGVGRLGRRIDED